MKIKKFIGKALIGAMKFGMGFGTTAVRETGRLASKIGSGAWGATKALGKGTMSATKAIGKPLVDPFATRENALRTLGNYGNLINTIGNKMVRVNDEGARRLTKLGLGLISGITLASKLNDNYYEAKSKALGTVDQKPTTATPNYNPVQYEMSPPKRIYPDSGGATGDLVFALHKLR